MKGNSWRSSPTAGSGGDGRNRRWQRPRTEHELEEGPIMVPAKREGKRDGDSMGVTSKRAWEQENGTRSMRRTRWCAHLRLMRNDGDGRARRRWRGVTGVGEEPVRVGEDDGVDVGFE
jgi:hypothetical protein